MDDCDLKRCGKQSGLCLLLTRRAGLVAVAALGSRDGLVDKAATCEQSHKCFALKPLYKD